MADAKAKRYVFFLRHFNDIDNIAPAIYYFLRESDHHRADVVLYHDAYDFRNDPNLRFLSREFEGRFSYGWLGERFGLSLRAATATARLKIGLHKALERSGLLRSPAVQHLRSLLQRSTSKLRRRPVLALSAICRGDSAAAVLDRTICNLLNKPAPPSLVVFDVVRTPTVNGLIRSIRKAWGGRIVCLPVSPLINFNVLREKSFVDVHSDSFHREHDYSGFDSIGFVDNYFADSYNRLMKAVGLDLSLTGRTSALGSIRYSPQWISIRDRFIASYGEQTLAARATDCKKLKVLFLLSRFMSNVNVDEVQATARMLSTFDSFDVLVKEHTREDLLLIRQIGGNLRTAGGIDTAVLIDWADVVLCWSTSAAIEGLVKGKYVVCLSYVASNKNLFAEFGAGYVAKCRDDLLLFLVDLGKGGTQLPYSHEGARNFLRTIIWNDHGAGSVPQRYLQFMRENEVGARDDVCLSS